MTAQELISICRDRGIKLVPGEGGRLRVSPPPERLPEDLREELRRRKAELLAVLQAPSWPCSLCGNQAEVEEVMSSPDGQRILTLWHCETCQAWGCTPDALRQPPVWVSLKMQ